MLIWLSRNALPDLKGIETLGLSQLCDCEPPRRNALPDLGIETVGRASDRPGVRPEGRATGSLRA